MTGVLSVLVNVSVIGNVSSLSSSTYFPVVGLLSHSTDTDSFSILKIWQSITPHMVRQGFTHDSFSQARFLPQSESMIH